MNSGLKVFALKVTFQFLNQKKKKEQFKPE